jgi:hypothetical protein
LRLCAFALRYKLFSYFIYSEKIGIRVGFPAAVAFPLIREIESAKKPKRKDAKALGKPLFSDGYSLRLCAFAFRN